MGENYQLPQYKRLSRFLQPRLQPVFFPTPLHVHAPFEAHALDISGSPFTVDAPSSGDSNNFDGFHEQSDTQLLLIVVHRCVIFFFKF